jgi:two-component system cell cycle response regulator
MKNSAEVGGLRQALLPLLAAGPAKEDKLLRELERRKASGADVFSPLLAILTHLSFSEQEAERHWRRIGAHRERLSQDLGRDPGLRVAILDYFQNVSRELRSPKLIELAVFERTERSAVTDGLTGLYNHAFFVQALRQELQRAKRHEFKTSLVLLDIDDFKHVNDSFGHLEGDRALVRTAELIRSSVRQIDIPARYGGEEFAVILPETTRTGAHVVAERVRQRIEQRLGRRKRGARVTISGGIATYPDDATNPTELIGRADQGLYRAKAQGKNRIVMVRGERRRFVRVPASHVVTLAARGRRAAARTKNVSAGGLLVSLKRPVRVGSAVSLLIRDAESLVTDLRGEIVRVERSGEKEAYDVGVRFIRDPHSSEQPAPRRRARA